MDAGGGVWAVDWLLWIGVTTLGSSDCAKDDNVLGKPRAFAHFFIAIAALGLLLAIRSHYLPAAVGLLALALLFAGSVAALWKVLSERGDARVGTFPSQLGAMPKKWQKWVLGQSDDRPSG
jgi:hypothetical protein